MAREVVNGATAERRFQPVQSMRRAVRRFLEGPAVPQSAIDGAQRAPKHWSTGTWVDRHDQW